MSPSRHQYPTCSRFSALDSGSQRSLSPLFILPSPSVSRRSPDFVLLRRRVLETLFCPHPFTNTSTVGHSTWHASPLAGRNSVAYSSIHVVSQVTHPPLWSLQASPLAGNKYIVSSLFQPIPPKEDLLLHRQPKSPRCLCSIKPLLAGFIFIASARSRAELPSSTDVISVACGVFDFQCIVRSPCNNGVSH